MFLDCQEEGKSVESMVGEDYKQYTENIISAVNPKKFGLKNIKKYLDVIVGAFFIMLTYDFVFSYLLKLLKGNFDLSYINKHFNYSYYSDYLYLDNLYRQK